jgi:exonuclease SbcC
MTFPAISPPAQNDTRALATRSRERCGSGQEALHYERMIPLRLRLRNFLSYREPEPLDFSSFHVACLCGENGHGKSTLLDGITWALWGRARARTDDELIHLGATEMGVEFEFQLGEARYRVIRQRWRQHKQGKAALELQVWDDDHQRFRTLTGNSILETERAIVKLLRLNYETFINSSFLLQGKADLFTTSLPSKRKEILGEILGLAEYDRLEQRSRELAKERGDTIRQLNARLEEIDRELANEPRYRAAYEAYDQQARQLKAELEGLEQEEKAQLQLREQLTAASARMSELERVQQQDRQQLAQRQERLEQDRRRLEEAERVLAAREEILAGYQALQQAQQVMMEESGKATRRDQLFSRQRALETAVREARQALEAERNRLRGQLDHLRSLATDLEPLAAQLKLHEQQVATLDQRRQAVEERRRALTALVEELAQRQAELKQLRAQVDELKERLEWWQTTERCPTCEQPISAELRDQHIAQLRAEGTSQADRFRALRAEFQNLQDRRQEEDAAVVQEERALKQEQEALNQALADVRARYDAARRATEQRSVLERRLGELEQRLERRAYAEGEQEELTRLQAELTALAFDAEALEAARARITALQPFAERYQQLARAEGEIERLRNVIRETEREVAQLSDRLADRERELTALRAQVEQLARVEGRLSEIRTSIGDTRSAYQRVIIECSRYGQLLDSCAQDRQRRSQYVAERETAAHEQGIFEELARAFGKGGVQALIIESVLPEIEADANELLRRMTDGRLHVSFQTQRETLQGKQVETLQVLVGDDLGTRSYELFSGGEAFRVNFAIRIALAKLLARRAGARLETLFIDEGFGTQDANGRDRLVEAIQAIQQDFAKILVVTHIEELKEAFPARIEVTKGPEGSRFTLSYR